MSKRTVAQRCTSNATLAVPLVLPLAIGMLHGNPLLAATLTVTNCNDSGSGSLRDAITTAHGGDLVDLSQLACSSISLTTGKLVVGVNDLSLHGPGAGKLSVTTDGEAVIEHKGTGTLRVDSLQITVPNSGYPYYFSCIRSAGSVYLNATTITKCRGTAAAAERGFTMLSSTISESYQAVSATAGNVSIRNSTITNNRGAFCPAFQIGKVGNTGSAEIVDSTISGNYSLTGYFDSGVGCIFQPTTIASSTIANNGSDGMYPGLTVSFVPVRLESSILANNVSHIARSDLTVFGGSISGHNNLITATKATVPADTLTADPQLLPLAANGGPTLTHALAATSPAIDAGNNSAGLTTDQRGAAFARVRGARADIGAFEVQSGAAVVVPASIGPAFTGSWYDPNQSGQGLALEVLDGNRILATWFTFDPNANQAWFTGVGTYVGNTATIAEMVQPEGARWIPNFNSADVVAVPWGPLTFTFSDCSHGRVDFASTVAGFGSGHMDLTRLTMPAGLSCP